jgi:hypothetical protein
MGFGDTLAFFVPAGGIFVAAAGANGWGVRDVDCQRGRVGSGIGISILVDVDGAFCSFYYLDRLWHVT